MKPCHTLLLATVILSGCGSTPEQWNQAFKEANDMNAGQRNYSTHPITAPTPGAQPSNQPNSNDQEYKTVMVNTPNGLVYKRCKVLNGQNVACF